MSLERRRLTDTEITEHLSRNPDWAYENGKVSRTFEFDTYAKGVAFAAAVGCIADALDHHPDLMIGYRKVVVAVNTHDVGGISPWDFELAARVDSLLKPA